MSKCVLSQVGLIGPATVGGIKPGCMRIGNTGGMLDNIVMSKVRFAFEKNLALTRWSRTHRVQALEQFPPLPVRLSY